MNISRSGKWNTFMFSKTIFTFSPPRALPASHITIALSKLVQEDTYKEAQVDNVNDLPSGKIQT